MLSKLSHCSSYWCRKSQHCINIVSIIYHNVIFYHIILFDVFIDRRDLVAFSFYFYIFVYICFKYCSYSTVSSHVIHIMLMMYIMCVTNL